MSGPALTAAQARRQALETFDRWRAAHPDADALLSAESRSYVEYHAVRYGRLLESVQGLVGQPAPGSPLHILDVGPNIQTAMFRQTQPGATVDTLGFPHPAVPPREHELHVRFDLNEAPDRSAWPRLDRRYDLIVVAEVLEHLHVPASAVLALLAEQLRSSGCIILQTPNAAALHKRLTLLVGRNPVEAPRVSRENPGHLHEYTIAELREQVRAGGLILQWLRAENYFGSGRGAAGYRAAGRLLPPTWRHGVTACARAAD